MSTDILNTYWDNLDVGALGVAALTQAHGEGPIDHNNLRGRGIGPGLWLEVSCTDTMEDITVAILFKFQQDTVANFASPTELARKQMVKTLPATGDLLWQIPLPAVTERYSMVFASWTTNCDEGSLSAYLTTAPQHEYTGRLATVVVP